jgi:serine/threonine protein kinase
MGIGHRDLKPDNILLSFKNKIPIVKIIDFGFAINSAESKTQCGTPNFMAP